MALVIADRVQETTTTTGTGTLNLAGASTGYQNFVAGVGTGNTTYYCILSGNGTDWEVGIGTVTDATPDTLSRTTILASSNSNAAISLTGTSTVFCTAPATLLGNAGLYGPILSRPIPTKANTGLTTNVNIGTATASDGVTGIVVIGATNANQISGISKSSPSTPYSIDVLIEHYTILGGGFGPLFGWYDGTKIHAFGLYTSTSGYPILYVLRYATAGSGGAAASVDFTGTGINTHPASLRIRDDGTNVHFAINPGGSYDQADDVYSVAKASGYLSAYSNIFFGINVNNGRTMGAILSYVER